MRAMSRHELEIERYKRRPGAGWAAMARSIAASRENWLVTSQSLTPNHQPEAENAPDWRRPRDRWNERRERQQVCVRCECVCMQWERGSSSPFELLVDLDAMSGQGVRDESESGDVGVSRGARGARDASARAQKKHAFCRNACSPSESRIVTAPWSVVGLVGRRQAGRSSTLSVSPHGALTRLPPRVQACQPSACRRARQGAANRPFAGLRRSTALRSTPCAMLCGASNAQTTVLGLTPCVRPECGERAVALASCCFGSSCESPTHCTRPLQSQLAKPAALRHSMRHAHSSMHRTVAT